MTESRDTPLKRATPLLAGFFGGILGAMIALAASDYYNNYAWTSLNVMDLRLHPVGYQDDSIVVSGYLVNDERSTKLYFDKESAELSERTLQFDVYASNSDDSERLLNCEDGYVEISGVFTRERLGLFHIRADDVYYTNVDQAVTDPHQCIP
ncbi:MAG TPA: hypothetical protein PKK10_03955 [Woeseiaceae bacterium]|nr:hypothetical protein [Woeseiaceae bacterium]